MFIILHNTDEVRINVEKITAYEKYEHGSIVSFDNSYYFYVKESPEQIDQMLRELYITVRSNNSFEKKEEVNDATTTSTNVGEETQSVFTDSPKEKQ